MKLAEYLANSFSREGIISDKDKEVVQFGLESLGGNLLGGILTLAAGGCFGAVWEAVFFWIFFFFLRKNAGGFHAKTKSGCLFISTAMLCLAFALFVLWDHTTSFYVICVLITGGLIWFMSPVSNATKRLDLVERNVYKKRSRIILGGETIIFLAALYFRIEVIMKSIVMTFFIVCISLLLGKRK